MQAENIYILIHTGCEGIKLKYGDMIVDMKDFHPYNYILNEVDVPKLEDENKIILARCIKVPLLDIFLYDIKDPLFIEKFEFLKKMTKTLEFIDKNINKLLQEIVPIS